MIPARPGPAPKTRPSVWPPAVVNEPCMYGKCPPEHNHTHNPFDASKPGYYPEPEDLVPGWTVQQIGRDRISNGCEKHCILCWEAEVDLRAHSCTVLAALMK